MVNFAGHRSLRRTLCDAYNNYYNLIAYTFATYAAKGHVPFRFKIKWNRKFLEIRFENFGSPLEVVLFSGNLEIPENPCSFGISTQKESVPLFMTSYKMAASLSSQPCTGCKMICHSSS